MRATIQPALLRVLDALVALLLRPLGVVLPLHADGGEPALDEGDGRGGEGGDGGDQVHEWSAVNEGLCHGDYGESCECALCGKEGKADEVSGELVLKQPGGKRTRKQ